MKYLLLLLLAALLTPKETDAIGCVLVCNGFCSAIFKLCTSVQSKSLSCLSSQTKCNFRCAKICSCVSLCDLTCSKPWDACRSTGTSSKKVQCTAQEELCKKLTCPLKCLIGSAMNIPALPDLPKLNAVSDIFQQAPGNLLQKTNLLMPNALQNLFPPVPSNPFSSLAGSILRPGEDISKPAQTSTNIGSSLLNPFGKPPNSAPATSPDSDEGTSPKSNPFPKPAAPPKESTTSANLEPNPAPVNPFKQVNAQSAPRSRFQLPSFG